MEGSLALLIPILAVLIGGLVILVPLAGLTARFAAKPIAEMITQAREGGSGGRVGELARRVESLEQQVDRLEQALEHQADAQAFERDLRNRAVPGASSKVSMSAVEDESVGS